MEVIFIYFFHGQLLGFGIKYMLEAFARKAQIQSYMMLPTVSKVACNL